MIPVMASYSPLDPCTAGDLRLREETPEVYYTNDSISVLYPGIIAFLKERALATPRQRCRICMHSGWDDPFQEMLIAHRSGHYMQPHRHVERTQSFRIVEGRALVVVFHDDGVIRHVFKTGDNEGAFYFRFPPSVYYCFLIESEWFVFFEGVARPFTPSVVEWAPWAPPENNTTAATAYSIELRRRALEAMERPT